MSNSREVHAELARHGDEVDLSLRVSETMLEYWGPQGKQQYATGAQAIHKKTKQSFY